MLIDLIIGVICKILASLFTIVNLQIACNNYLYLSLQTMGAPDTRGGGVYSWNIQCTGVIGRRRTDL